MEDLIYLQLSMELFIWNKNKSKNFLFENQNGRVTANPPSTPLPKWPQQPYLEQGPLPRSFVWVMETRYLGHDLLAGINMELKQKHSSSALSWCSNGLHALQAAV